jgi:predicted dienelactone hydrolase
MRTMNRLVMFGLGAALVAGAIPRAGAEGRLQPPAPSTPTVPAAAAADADTTLYKSDAGPMVVKTIDENWADGARNRTIPVRVYLPTARTPATKKVAAPSAPASMPAIDVPKLVGPEKPAAGAAEKPIEKFPVIVFSPGLGASRIGYGYFARHLASHGYLVVVLSHPGSDTAANIEWVRSHGGMRSGQGLAPNEEDDSPGGWLMTSINDPNNLRERPRDVSFVIDHIAPHATLGPIADMSRMGVSGHSFGAYTAMAIGGMTVDLPESHGAKSQSFRDKRIKAVLPMSPEGTGGMGIVEGAWKSFEVTVLFLTGTRDYGAGGRSASWRRQAFEAVRGVDDYLITLQNAGHLTFANRGGLAVRDGVGGRTSQQEALIDSLGVAFFDAYLRGDAEAKKFLGGVSMTKRRDCIAESHPKELKEGK